SVMWVSCANSVVFAVISQFKVRQSNVPRIQRPALDIEMPRLGLLCAYNFDSLARDRNVRAHQFIKLFGYFREVVVPRMRDFPFSTVSSEPVFCEHEVSARGGVFIRQSVAHEDRCRASSIEQTHHRRFAGRTAMSARLVERRKINSPTICVRLHVARKNPNATQM